MTKGFKVTLMYRPYEKQIVDSSPLSFFAVHLFENRGHLAQEMRMTHCGEVFKSVCYLKINYYRIVILGYAQLLWFCSCVLSIF